MGADRWDEQVGSVADEASRLLESLRRSVAEDPGHGGTSGGAEARAGAGAGAGARPASAGTDEPRGAGGGRHRPASGAHAAGGERAEEHDPGEPAGGAVCVDPFCAYCPLCRSAAVIRSLSPETLARLADLASVAATVLADLASTRTSGDGGEGAATRPARPEPSAAQPIPVSDDDAQEAPRG